MDGINVGDAVLTMLADTTQLDQAIDNVNASAKAKLQPAADAATAIGEAFEEAGAKANESGKALDDTGKKIKESGDKASESQKKIGEEAEKSADAQRQAAELIKIALEGTDEKWLAIAEANLEVAKATEENIAAQDELRSAIEFATTAGNDKEEGLLRVAEAEEKTVETAQKLKEAEDALAASFDDAAKAAQDAELSLGGYNDATGEATSSTEEFDHSADHAKDSIGILSGLLGIHLPRQVKKYISSLETVAPIMNLAFKALVIAAIIKAIIDAGEALGDFISDIFIYTQAQKDALAAQVLLNNALLEQSTRLKELKRDYDFLGLEGSRKTVIELDKLTAEIEKNETALKNASATAFFYDRYLEGTAATANKAKEQILLLSSTLNKQRQEQANLEKRLEQENTSEEIALGLARVDARRLVLDAIANLEFQQKRVQLESTKVNYVALIAADVEYQNTIKENELNAMRGRLEQFKKDPIRNAAAITDIAAQITAAEKRNLAERFKNFADWKAKINKLLKEDPPTIDFHWDKVVADSEKAADKVTDALKTIGIEGVASLGEELIKAQKAYDILKKSGLAATGDLYQAEMHLLELRIAIGKQFGFDMGEQQKELDTLKDKYDVLTNATQKFMNRQIDLFALWHKELPRAGRLWKDLSSVGKHALDGFSEAAQSAFTAAILGEDSFGHALRKGTATTLAEIASRSLVYALFYTAKGFALLAEHDYPGATLAFHAAALYGTVGVVSAAAAYAINPRDNKENNGDGIAGKPIDEGNSSSTGGQGTNAAAIAAQPVTVRNVQRFGVGSLVTRPTLAMIGDAASGATGAAQEEGVLPLDNEDVMRHLATRIAEAGLGSVHHEWNIGGVISADTLDKVITKITRRVNKGNSRLTSSNALKVTKR